MLRFDLYLLGYQHVKYFVTARNAATRRPACGLWNAACRDPFRRGWNQNYCCTGGPQ